jgi:hypothetical protein
MKLFYFQVFMTTILLTVCLANIIQVDRNDRTWEKLTIAMLMGYWMPSPLEKQKDANIK